MTCDKATVLSMANRAGKDRGSEEKPGSRSSSSMNEAYTSAILRGRHPRSFRNERGIFRYFNDSNHRVTLRQRSRGHEGKRHQQQRFRRPPPQQGDRVSHDHDAHRQQAELDSLYAHPSADADNDCDPIKRRSLSPPVGMPFAPYPSSPEESGSANYGYDANDGNYHASGSQPSSLSPARLSTAQSPYRSRGIPLRITPETEKLQEKSHNQQQQQQKQQFSRVSFSADAPRLLNNSGVSHLKPPQDDTQEGYQYYPMRRKRRGPRKEPLEHSSEQSGGGCCVAGGVRRRPQTSTTLSSLMTITGCQKSPATYRLGLRSRGNHRGTGSGADRDAVGSLGGYMVRHGCSGDKLKGGNVGRVRGGHGCPGGNGQINLVRGGGMGQMGQQQERGGDRPLTAHQKFNAMIGAQKESQARNEDEIHVLDSLNHDPSLRLHYGLHITLQAVQGETGYFMTLDRDTGAVSMRLASGVETRGQQMTFKLVDLEDPASYRSVLYGTSVWLQIISGPGEPTWKQGSAIGARVRGPGMLPTVEIDHSHRAATWSALGPDEGSCRAASSRPLVGTLGNRNLDGNARGTPGGVIASGDCEEGSTPGGGGGEAPEVGVNERRSAVGGGNTDLNRPVGVPFPFKAATSNKLGDSIGTTSEIILRMINKGAMMNCRWIVRPVRPDGEAIPSLSGTEVRNMDCVFLEQDFFYMTRVNENASVVLKALRHKSGPSIGHKHHQAFYPVGRRGVFKLQVAETDEPRPGEERSAALMRKAKRGLKSSESRRLGRRTYYVHKQRPGDSLSGGMAFPREIRARTARFASESESRAISTASSSFLSCPAPPTPMTEKMMGTSEDRCWMSTAGSWDARVLHTMSCVERGDSERGGRVAASHARVLREWRRRWRRLFSSHRPSPFEEKTSRGTIHSEGNEISPMCPRCRYLSRKMHASDGTDRSPPADDLSLGQYCLCSINREIQCEVSQSCSTNALSMEGMWAYRSPSLAASPVSISGGTAPAEEGEGATVDSAGGARLTSSPPGSFREIIVLGSPEKGSRAGPSLSPAAADGLRVKQGFLLSKEASASVFSEPRFSSSVGSSTSPGGVPSSGLKKGRNRRPNQRKDKEDPSRVLEEMLLDGFSIESITRQLEREDETLQKGVRHMERVMEQLKTERRHHSSEKLQRPILTPKRKLEAAVSDAPPASIP